MVNFYRGEVIARTIFFIVFAVAFFFTSSLDIIRAQDTSSEKSYSHPSIDFYFHVNQDSTVNVDEIETFKFNGKYNMGWRSLSLSKVDQISNIAIYDGETYNPLKYVSKRLDKLDPDSWGSYTIYNDGHAKNIEWYFNEEDSTHTWIIKYKLHGAIGFYDDHDELYWNLVTDFTVPINEIRATVSLPADNTILDRYAFYRNNYNSPMNRERLDNRTFLFTASNIEQGEDVTIAPGWQKGIVDQRAYWIDFIYSFWGVIGSIILVILAGLASLISWYLLEKKPMDRMTIIPQYEPPENLPPAMAEIILREKISDKAWPATVIDLACKGYLTIKEEKSSFWDKITTSDAPRMILGSLMMLLFIFVSLNNNGSYLVALIGVVFGAFFIYELTKIPNNEYILKKTDKDQSFLSGFEIEYLGLLFSQTTTFSTLDEKKNKNVAHAKDVYKRMKTIRKDLYAEMNVVTKAFAILPRWRQGISIIAIVYILFELYPILFGLSATSDTQNIIFIIGVILTVLIIITTIRNPRLNGEGREMKAKWLGFKLYLETAEKYRMQNLTPDMFEKYLPYAMIFGIEKKWAKAFDSLNVVQPVWYTTSGAYLGAAAMSHSSFSSGFSASSFSSSFSSSFATSFSGGTGGSSGGGSGGGGGAGGGGGGGGGGAS